MESLLEDKLQTKTLYKVEILFIEKTSKVIRGVLKIKIVFHSSPSKLISQEVCSQRFLPQEVRFQSFCFKKYIFKIDFSKIRF